MAGILEKLRLIGLSNIHSLLDKAIDMNSVGAVEQHVRDLKQSRKVMDEAVASSIARERTLLKQKGEKAARVATLTSVITTVLEDGDPTNDHVAEKKMGEKLRLDKEVAKLDESIATEAQTKGTLQEALTLLNSRLAELEARLDTLRSTEKQAAAKEEAASALAAAREILDRSPGSSVDNALQRAEDRETRAGVKLETEMGRLRTSTNQDDADLEARAAVAELKKQLQAKAAPAAA